MLAAMKLVLSLACEHADVRPDGKVDVTGIFNELSAPGFPASQDQMTVVFVVEWADGESGKQQLRAELMDETGQTVLTIKGHTLVEPRAAGAGLAHTRLIMPLEDVVFPQAGRYRFRLTAGGETSDAFSLYLHEHPAD